MENFRFKALGIAIRRKPLKVEFPVKKNSEYFGENTLKQLPVHITSIQAKVDQMIEERKKANKVEDTTEKATLYNKEVFPFLEEIRKHIDNLELLVDDELWPMPKYRELLFIK